MWRALCIGLLFTSLTIYSQTKAIAFKSHSGNTAHYTADGAGNLGIIEPTHFLVLDSVVKLNDSVVVQYSNADDGSFWYDTLVNDPSWCKEFMNLDSVKNVYNNKVEFIGFKAKPKLKTSILMRKKSGIEFFAILSHRRLIGGLCLLVIVAGLIVFGRKKQRLA